MTSYLSVLEVFGGVDTHTHTHHAAVVDQLGRELADREFPATRAGYEALHAWLMGFGRLVLVGVEGTGSYGAGVMRLLTSVGTKVVEVDRPDRSARRAQGKSDPPGRIRRRASGSLGQGDRHSEVARRHRRVATLSPSRATVGDQGPNPVHQPDPCAPDQRSR